MIANLTTSSHCGCISSYNSFWVCFLGTSVIMASFSSIQSLTHVRLFVTPWTAAHQASLSISNSQSFLKLMSIESVMPSNHLILCRPLLLQSLPASGSFLMSQFLASGGQSIGASASILPMNIQKISPKGNQRI